MFQCQRREMSIRNQIGNDSRILQDPGIRTQSQKSACRFPGNTHRRAYAKHFVKPPVRPGMPGKSLNGRIQEKIGIYQYHLRHSPSATNGNSAALSTEARV